MEGLVRGMLSVVDSLLLGLATYCSFFHAFSNKRQDMFSLPPPVLTLHLNRSSYDYHYASKNACQVIYPSILDLSPFSTNGNLSLSSSSPISPSNSFLRVESSAPLPSSLSYNPRQPTYQLSSAIYHYGSHASGHYITYRRIPYTERWLKVSDDDVLELKGGVGDVRRGAGQAFMLFYELCEEEPHKGREGENGVVVESCGDASQHEGIHSLNHSSSSPPSPTLTSPSVLAPIVLPVDSCSLQGARPSISGLGSQCAVQEEYSVKSSSAGLFRKDSVVI